VPKEDAWEGLRAPWRRSFALAWQAQVAGSVPIGAVIFDGAGNEVAAGRNRVFESEVQPGQLAGMNIAHAEATPWP